MELHTESHDGQTDGSTSEAVGKTHRNVCALYTPLMGVNRSQVGLEELRRVGFCLVENRETRRLPV